MKNILYKQTFPYRLYPLEWSSFNAFQLTHTFTRGRLKSVFNVRLTWHLACSPCEIEKSIENNVVPNEPTVRVVRLNGNNYFFHKGYTPYLRYLHALRDLHPLGSSLS